MEKQGILSVVATPIGNMEDITLRAIRVLREADYILCEDTRVTGNLLKHHGIETKLRRYDAHASEKVHEGILRDLEEGKHIALVSDAGTPGVSDPGVMLVAQARSAGVRIDAIPGASAVTAAFSIAGISGNSFAFLGFAPQKKGRQTFFKTLPDYDMPVMFYEAPHRIMKTLESLLETFENEPVGEGENSTTLRTITIARELTKMFEEVVQGTPSEVLQYFIDHSDKVRGEFVVMVHMGINNREE
jgi:16S rRNA (cytidine1402-2'-O)-methyltransferase